MSRRVIDSADHAAGAVELDSYFDKVYKYIPADVVAAYLAAAGLIASTGDNVQKSTVLWIVFVVGLLATALWTNKNAKKEKQPPPTGQIIISTIAFAVWVFALGGPFASLAWYAPVYGSLGLIGYTLLAPLVPVNQK